MDDLHDLHHKRLSLSRWLKACDDENAWRWTTEEHYAYLRDTANELLQLGEITLATRDRIALEAFRRYLAVDRLNERAQSSYQYRYEYLVYEGEKIVAELGCTGHLFEPGTHAIIGYISSHYGDEAEFEITRYVGFEKTLVGLVRGLAIERPAAESWRLAPAQLSPSPKRWGATAY